MPLRIPKAEEDALREMVKEEVYESLNEAGIEAEIAARRKMRNRMLFKERLGGPENIIIDLLPAFPFEFGFFTVPLPRGLMRKIDESLSDLWEE